MDKFKVIHVNSSATLEEIRLDTIKAFMFADLGAMGDAGELKYYCKNNDMITVYCGNCNEQGIDVALVEKLHDKLLDRDQIFPKTDWFYFSLGYGNHLYLRTCYRDEFLRRCENTENHIYLCYDKIIESILEDE